MNIEVRYSVYFLLKRQSAANPPFDIRYSIFCCSAVRFYLNVVSHEDMQLRLPFLTPETKFAEQKRFKKLSLCA